MNWGLIGAGDIVRKRVAAALRDATNSRLTAIARGRAEAADASARELGAERWHASWQDLVRDPGIDAVYVATPVHLHCEQTIAAAQAGKHVLCEKPMAMTVADCDRMIAAGRANGVTIGVAYYRHLYPVIVRMREILASGEIGDPVFVQVDAFERFNPQPGEPRHWFVTKAAAGGGPMFDFGCHRIQLLLDMFGPVTRVVGVTTNVIFKREVEDTAIGVMQFARGTCATLSVTHAASEPRDTFRVFGTAGSIHVPVLNAGAMTIITAAGERHESHQTPSNLHQPLIQDFVDAVLAGRSPAVTGEVGRAVADVEAQIYGQPAVPATAASTATR
jgi:predicted dehydrogenase